jgi:hypothetical protein
VLLTLPSSGTVLEQIKTHIDQAARATAANALMRRALTSLLLEGKPDEDRKLEH